MDYTIIYHETGKDAMYKTWHSSEYAMFIYMHSDGGSIVCSEKTYPIKKGTLCFVGAGKYHYTMPDIPKNYDRSKLFVTPDFLRKIQELLPENTRHSFTNDTFIYAQVDEENISATENIFKEIKDFETDKTHSDLMLLSGLAKLMFLTDKYSLDKIPSASGFMNKAIEYINRNIFNEITIDEICSAIHMSKYYFCRQFKINTGLTVMDYILKTRIVLAKNMLEKENLSVTEISEQCGFSSISYFCRVFKTETGMTPLKFQKSKK